jgi:hypothetical protein
LKGIAHSGDPFPVLRNNRRRQRKNAPTITRRGVL